MTVTCFKTGKKSVYTYEHVNKLYNMIDRNTTHEFNFICFTNMYTNTKVYKFYNFVFIY